MINPTSSSNKIKRVSEYKYMNKRQRKKAMNKFFESDSFKNTAEAMNRRMMFAMETPILNILFGEEPYKFREIWDKKPTGGVWGEPSQYEEDHFESLELCGCPRCPENLWPQPWPEARKKDVEETRLHRAVCKGEMTLQEAQDQIRKDWTIH